MPARHAAHGRIPEASDGGRVRGAALLLAALCGRKLNREHAGRPIACDASREGAPAPRRSPPPAGSAPGPPGRAHGSRGGTRPRQGRGGLLMTKRPPKQKGNSPQGTDNTPAAGRKQKKGPVHPPPPKLRVSFPPPLDPEPDAV